MCCKSHVFYIGRNIGRIKNVHLRMTLNVTVERAAIQVRDTAVLQRVFAVKVSGCDSLKGMVEEDVPFGQISQALTQRATVVTSRQLTIGGGRRRWAMRMCTKLALPPVGKPGLFQTDRSLRYFVYAGSWKETAAGRYRCHAVDNEALVIQGLTNFIWRYIDNDIDFNFFLLRESVDMERNTCVNQELVRDSYILNCRGEKTDGPITLAGSW